MEESGLSLAREARSLIRRTLYREAFQLAAKARDHDPQCAQAYVAEGMALFGLGKYDESLAALAEGLSAVPTDHQLLKTIIEVALKSPLKAEFIDNLSRLEESNLSNNAFVICSLIGQDLQRVKHHQAAIDVLESALEIGTNSSKLRGSVLACLGSAYWAVGERDQAKRNMKEELLLCQQNKDIEGEFRALGNLAAAAKESGKLTESISCLREQIRVSRSFPDLQSQAAISLSELTSTEMTLQSLEKIGARAQTFLLLASREQGKWEKKLSLKKAVSVASRLKDEKSMIQGLLSLGQILIETKEHSEAIQNVERAQIALSQSESRNIFKDKIEEARLRLEACATLATCYRAVGDHRKTINVANLGSSLARQVNNPDVEFHCLGEEGRAHQALKEWSFALDKFKSQRELLTLSSLPIAWADCLLGIADCLIALDNSPEAIEVLLELISCCDREFDLQIGIYSRLSRLQEEFQNDLRGAIKSTESLLFAAIKINEPKAEITAYRTLGRLHFRLGHLQAAEKCLEKAMSLDHNAILNLKEIEIELANIAFQLKNFQKARSLLQTHHDFSALYILAQIEEESANHVVAIDLYKSILEKCKDGNIKEAAGSRLAKCLQKIDKHDEAVEALRDVVKNIRETESIHESTASSQSLNRTMISSAHSLESTADGFHNTLILTLAESLAAVGKIEEALDEASQAGEVGSSLRELLLVRLGKLQEALEERVKIIRPGLHFSLCRLDLHCWLVNENGRVIAFCGQSGASEQLIKLQKTMLRELAPRLDNSDLSDSGDSGMSLSDASSYLYDALISPFESELEKETYLSITCHDFRLLSIPWASLSPSPETPPLFKKFCLSLIPPTQSNVLEPSQPISDPKIFRIKALEASEETDQSESSEEQRQKRTTQSAVVSSLEELKSSLADQKCIQLSLDLQCSSEIILSDEKHLISQIFLNFDLSHVDLVILDRPNSTELAQAFLEAGAKSVIFPLWKVPKTATKDLKNSISTALESMDPISALQDAQLKQLKGKQFKDPSFWSAWLAMGLQNQADSSSLITSLYNLLRAEPDRARRTLLQVQLGSMPLSPLEDVNEQLMEEFTSLCPSLLALPIETLSTIIPLLPKRKILSQVRKEIDNFLVNKVAFNLDFGSWSVPGCHEFLLSMELDVIEMNSVSVSLVGGSQSVLVSVQSALNQLLSHPDTTPESQSVELVENSPIVSESSSSPLRHSESSPFRVIPRKSKKLETDLDEVKSLTEVRSVPEMTSSMTSPKRPVVTISRAGNHSLPPMHHKFRSLWLEDEKSKENFNDEDQSSGFGSGEKT